MLELFFHVIKEINPNNKDQMKYFSKEKLCLLQLLNYMISFSIYIQVNMIILNGIKVRVFFRKKRSWKYLCRHDRNYYYFWKSNIPVIKLIVHSRNMIKVSKNMSLWKNRWRKKVAPTQYWQFVAFFIVFEWVRNWESAIVKCNEKLRRK